MAARLALGLFSSSGRATLSTLPSRAAIKETQRGDPSIQHLRPEGSSRRRQLGRRPNRLSWTRQAQAEEREAQEAEADVQEEEQGELTNRRRRSHVQEEVAAAEEVSKAKEQWASIQYSDDEDDDEEGRISNSDDYDDEDEDPFDESLYRIAERRRTGKEKRKQTKRLEISERLLEERAKRTTKSVILPPEPITTARATRLINELKLLCGRSAFGNPKSVWSQVALESLAELLAEIHECLRLFTNEEAPPSSTNSGQEALALRSADVTTIVISLARASIANYSMLEDNEQLNSVWDYCLLSVLPRLPPDTPKDLANVLWAIAKRQRSLSNEGANIRPLVDSLSALTVAMARRCSAQELSNIMWAFGRLEVQLSPELHNALSKSVVERRSAFIPQGVTNVLWAFGRLRQQPSEACLRALLGFITERHGKYNSQCIANTITALAELKLPSSTCFPVVDLLLAKGQKIASSFNALELSNTFLGLAELGYPNQDERLIWLYVAVAQKIEFVGGAGLANVLWYHSKLQIHFPDPSFTRIVVERLLQILDKCTSNEVADITWSLSRIPNVTPSLTKEFTEALGRAIHASLVEFEPDERTRCLLGAAALGIQVAESA